jgi:hypothetical protein
MYNVRLKYYSSCITVWGGGGGGGGDWITELGMMYNVRLTIVILQFVFWGGGLDNKDWKNVQA